MSTASLTSNPGVWEMNFDRWPRVVEAWANWPSERSTVWKPAGRGMRRRVCAANQPGAEARFPLTTQMERAKLKAMKALEVPRSGRDGEWVYYMRGSKQCRRRYVHPKDPRTAEQLRQRAALSAASKAWSRSGQLTEPGRQACCVVAAELQSRKRLGQSGPLTGQQLFVRQNCDRDGVGRETRWEPRQGKGTGEIRRPKPELRKKSDDRRPIVICRRPASTRMPFVLNGLPGLEGQSWLRRDGVTGECGQGREPGSTWGQCRSTSVVVRWRCRRGEVSRHRGENAQGRRKPSRNSPRFPATVQKRDWSADILVRFGQDRNPQADKNVRAPIP
jgi:hypothetical protein